MSVFPKYATSVSTLALAALMLGPASVAYAQTASQVARKSYAPSVVHTVKGGVAIATSSGLKTPAGAEALSVTPSGLIVEGALPELADETACIEASIKDHRVTGADLFAAARDLEEAYARAGYLLVRVSLPPQTIKDGMPLKLIVINGRVDKVDTSALPDRAAKRVATVTAPLIGKPGLTKRELERRLLLAGDTPGVKLKSTLKAGEAFGTTTIVTDGRYNPVTAFATADNSLSDEMGTYTTGLGVDFNNLLSLGEVGYLRLSGYPGSENGSILASDPRNRQIVAGITMPIGIDGLWFNLEGVDSRTHSSSALGYSMPDHYQKLSTSLGYHWLRGRNANTASILSFDVVGEKQTLDLSGTRSVFSEDQLRVVRLTQTGDVYAPWGGHFSGSATLSFGLDQFGARSATNTLPMSRDGAEPSFKKQEASLSYNQAFANNHVLLSLAAREQMSFGEALAASEQLGITGMNWLSAFDSGEIQGDTGAVTRAELAFPNAVPGMDKYPAFGATAAPYVFGAAGIAKLEEPTSLEEDITKAFSFGAGIRFGLSKKESAYASTLSLEYAHGGGSEGVDTANRFNIRLVSKF